MHCNRLLTLLVSVALCVFALAPSAASAWAPASSATIHPGVQVFTAGAQCTSNFVYQDGSDVYLGQAAHCSGTGSSTDTDGCSSASLPIGTPVDISGASRPGTLAYNSWLTMQARHEADADTCAYNDLALIKIDPADVSSVNPSVPVFGGPTGLGSWGGPGSTVYTYGNSELRGGVSALSAKQGVVVDSTASGWSHDVYTVTPGIPGDSGSGFLDANGGAIGILSTVEIAPLAGANGVGDLPSEIGYARANGVPGLQLVAGTQPYSATAAGAVAKGVGVRISSSRVRKRRAGAARHRSCAKNRLGGRARSASRPKANRKRGRSCHPSAGRR